MKLIVIGMNHKTAPLEIREQFAFSPEKTKEALLLLLEKAFLQECFILSTCNRVEIYAATSQPALALAELKNFLSQFHSVNLEKINSFFYTHTYSDAVSHGFSVAAGLDSMVLGESQIFSQMKEAYRLATEVGGTGPLLNRYFHRVFHVAKKVRTETEMANIPVSVSYVAVMLAKKIFGNLEGKKALLLGAGKMSELALRHLKSQGNPEIWIANRSFEKALVLAEACQGQAIHFSDFHLSLPLVDVVITSTSSQEYLLTLSQIQEAMRLRKNRPLFIIDIAVPRNVAPEIHRVFNVYLYDLDDLQKVVESNLKEKKEEGKKAEAIILQESARFLEELKILSLHPTIERLAKKFDKVRQQELEKTFSKLKDLNAEQKAVLEACTQAIVNKILHEPLLALKAEPPTLSSEGRHPYLDLLHKLFRLDEGIK